MIYLVLGEIEPESIIKARDLVRRKLIFNPSTKKFLALFR
jgi:hypothetical protein